MTKILFFTLILLFTSSPFNVALANNEVCTNALKIGIINIELINAIQSSDLTAAQDILWFGTKIRKINPRFQDGWGQTALMYAAKRNYGTLALQLIGYGAEPNDRDHYGRTALMYAAMNDNLITARILLNAGADPDAIDENGWDSLKLTRLFESNRVARYIRLHKKRYTKNSLN